LLKAKLGGNQLIDHCRVRFAAGGLHDLTDKPTGQLRVLLGFFDLIGVRGDNFVNRGFNRTGVGDLFHAFGVHDLGRVAVLGIGDVKDVFCDLARDITGLNQADDLANAGGADRAVGDICVIFLKTTEKFVNHPVGSQLAVIAVGDLLKEGGIFSLGGQDGSVVIRQPEISDKAGFFRVGQLWQGGSDIIDPRLFNLERQQVWVGEITIVVRFFL